MPMATIHRTNGVAVFRSNAPNKCPCDRGLEQEESDPSHGG